MTRKYLAAFTAIAAVSVVSAIAGTGCAPSGVGDPCIPEAEYSNTFQGFDPGEVNVESKSFQCLTRLCLVNHFRGRVSCPYGQNPAANGSFASTTASANQCNGKGASNDPTSPCCIPGVDEPITSSTVNASGMKDSTVLPNCTDRTADKAVYCSCRCANSDGKTDDGAVYCGCPDGFSCTQLVSQLGSSNQQLAGAYCTKNKTDYNSGNSCQNPCSSISKNCGPSNNAQF